MSLKGLRLFLGILIVTSLLISSVVAATEFAETSKVQEERGAVSMTLKVQLLPVDGYAVIVDAGAVVE